MGREYAPIPLEELWPAEWDRPGWASQQHWRCPDCPRSAVIDRARHDAWHEQHPPCDCELPWSHPDAWVRKDGQ